MATRCFMQKDGIMRNWLLGFILASVSMPLAGCDEPARPKRPPTNNATEETTDDLRNRRRSGSSTWDEQADAERRDADDPRREERRRPEYQGRVSTAAEEAEDERDAAADRPTRAEDE
jgi:hypothetical protein